MRVLFIPPTNVQLREIHDYVAKDNLAAADAIVSRIEHLTGLLADNPYMGRRLTRGRRRRLTVAPYPYLIYYEIVGDTVRILSIRHAARFRRAFQEPRRAFAR
jgi:plasmid stabilization system protein ParE